MTERLTADDLSGRLAALRGVAVPDPDRSEVSREQGDGLPSTAGTGGDRYASPSDRHRARPLSDIADDLIDTLVNTAGRYRLGLERIDWITRGVGPGELMFLTGRSYSGKTNVFINSIFRNRHRNIVIVTMDEPAEHVLAKLFSLSNETPFEEVERKVKAEDPETLDAIRAVAKDLSNVLVVDDVFSFEGLDGVMAQAQDYFQAAPAVVFIDYLGLLSGDTDDAFSSIENKARALKRWAQGHAVPVICVHQGTRSNAGKGQKLGMEAMAYGGENEAFHIVGVRRLRDDESLDTWQRDAHKDTVSISVIKSKRLPMRRGEWTYHLDPNSGAITERFEDEPDRTVPPQTMQEVMGF